MGLFDRPVDDHVLMDLPELYKHSKAGEYFNLRLFLIYMLDGAYQVNGHIFPRGHQFTNVLDSP